MSQCRRAKLDEASEGSVNSETVHLPLPEHVDMTGFEISSNHSVAFPEEYSPSETYEPEPTNWEPRRSLEVGSLDERSTRNLRSMIEDSCLRSQPAFKFVMPWDRPGFSAIFSNKRKAFTVPTPVMQLIEPSSSSLSTVPSIPLPNQKVKRGCYGDVINFNSLLTESEVEEKHIRQALEKWYIVFSTGRDAWPRGFDLQDAVANKQLDDMKLVFGSRSTNTILRRGSSMAQFVSWYRSQFFSLCPFPLTPETVEEYVQHMHKSNRSASAIHGFLEALTFCEHVLGMTVGFSGSPLVTHKVQKILELEDLRRREKTQARLLTVSEVEFLEMCLTDERLDLVDRVACGTMLFCLYSRSRWSDLRKVYGFIQDINEKEGKISGYLECRTRSHKTARLVSRGGVAMPLVAPVWGVSSTPWGISLFRLFEMAHRPLQQLDHQPMLVAPTTDGSWSQRAVTTSESGKWLRKLLSLQGKDSEYATAHSLKSTPLSWCAKWGLDPDVRLILGHHKTGKASAECYGRDNLAKLLRDFDLVLQRIRTKAFVPDATRSGMVGPAETIDPSESFTAPALPAEGSSEGSSSEGSSDESSSSESAHADLNDEVVAPKTWDPDTIMYRNRRSKIVHVVASGGAESFSCGVRITDDFEKIAESPFLDIRRCKRCSLARPIKTVGQLASAFKKLRQG